MWRAVPHPRALGLPALATIQAQVLSRLLGATQVPEPAAPKAQTRHAAPRETTAQEASPLQRIPQPRACGAQLPRPYRPLRAVSPTAQGDTRRGWRVRHPAEATCTYTATYTASPSRLGSAGLAACISSTGKP